MHLQKAMRNTYLSLVIAMITIPWIARAQIRCESVFAQTPQELHAMGSPIEYHYLGNDGVPRLFRDGNIYEMRDMTWVQVGTGIIAPGGNSIIELLDTGIPKVAATDRLGSAGNAVAEQGFRPSLETLGSFNLTSELVRKDIYYWNASASIPSLVRRLKIDNHILEIAVPQGMESHMDGLFQTVLRLPRVRIESTTIIRLNDRPCTLEYQLKEKHPTFFAVATAMESQIDIYVGSVSYYSQPSAHGTDILRHEFGHTIAHAIYGTHVPDSRYMMAKQSDNTSVSDYGNTSLSEDFAEGIKAYLQTNAGRLDPEVRQKLQNRFKIFDELFSKRTPQGGRLDLFIDMINPTTLIAIDMNSRIGIILNFN